MLQGDAYGIPINITADGTVVTPDMVETVEITLGNIRKIYPDEITFSDGWIFPVTQEETFKLAAINHNVEVRVKFNTGEVIGEKVRLLDVEESRSKEVL